MIPARERRAWTRMEVDRLIVPPGVYFDVPHELYHADPAPAPSISASQCETLLETSPYRAWFANSRMNPDAPERVATTPMDEGSALHRLISGAGPTIAEIDFGDYKKDAAKEARAAARARGEIPILSARLEDLRIIARHAAQMIADHPEAAELLEDDYASEVTMLWQEMTESWTPDTTHKMPWCRARADRMHRTDPRRAIYDFKFTDRLTSPFGWDRSFVNSYWDLRAAFYGMGSLRTRGFAPAYRYVIVEKNPPYDVTVLQATPEMLALGEAKAMAAIRAWEACMVAGHWPRYPARIFHVSPPPYAEAKWMERPDMDHMLPAPKALPNGERISLWQWLQDNLDSEIMSAG